LIAIITDAFAKAKDWNYRLRPAGKGPDKRPAGEDTETPQELHERSLELKSMINEVDTEKLWTRLMEGVKDGETALDSAELAFLFNGSEKDARLFIDRVCTIGGLKRVEIEEEVTTIDSIVSVENRMSRLDEHIGGLVDIFETSYPEILPHMYPDLYTEVNDNNDQEHREAFLALTEAPNNPTDIAGLVAKGSSEPKDLKRQESIMSERSGSFAVRGKDGKTKKYRKSSVLKRTGGMFGDHAPQRGDLKRAAQALEIKKANVGQIEDAAGGGRINMDSLTSGPMEDFVASPKLTRL